MKKFSEINDNGSGANFLMPFETDKKCPTCGRVLYAVKMPFQPLTFTRCACQIERDAKEAEAKKKWDEAEQIKENVAQSGMTKLQRSCTFNSFERRAKTEKALSIARRYADSFPNVNKGLLFIGSCGSGKTHLALAIGNAILQKGYTVRFLTASRLFRDLKETFNSYDITENDILNPLLRCNLLILDDLGVSAPSEWSKSVLHDLISDRIDAQKPTICTTNLNFDQLPDRLDSRTVDRLQAQNFAPVWMNATSYRKEQ